MKIGIPRLVFLYCPLALIGLLVLANVYGRLTYRMLCKDGLSKIEVSKQIAEHYRDSDPILIEGGYGRKPAEWQSEAFLDGRFKLTYVTHVSVNHLLWRITPLGDASFQITALASIKPPKTEGNGSEGFFDTNLQRTFGVAEWMKFVRSGYDLTALGIPKSEIHPIPHWAEYVHGWRKDR
jgi:hypothetical protein